MTEPVVRPIPVEPDLPFPLGRAGVHHDPQSRLFAFTAPEPRPIVDVAWRRRVPVYDQGPLGCCTGAALCGALSTAPHRHRFRSARTFRSVYSDATSLDPWPGSWKPEDTGSDGLSVAKVALRRGYISEYRHIFRWDDFLQAMMIGPVIVGTEWRNEMFHAEPDGRVHPLGSVAGGHEYEAFGVDVTERRVWFFNSWGEGWSIKGRFWMAWDDFRGLLAEQGDATVLVP